jgi:hypothetical protein
LKCCKENPRRRQYTALSRLFDRQKPPENFIAIRNKERVAALTRKDATRKGSFRLRL